MKKILAILMMVVMAVALAACGGSSSGNETTKGEAAADETYTYTVDTGNYKNVWTLALLSDGSYTLTEHNGLLNVDTEHAGKTFTKKDDKIECGPWDDPTGVPDFCEKDGSITWQISGDTIEPFIDLSNASALCGTYTYVQDRGDFEMTYTIVLNYDWSWTMEIFHGLRGSSETFAGDTWEELSDTSFKTGPREVEETERDFFDEDGSCVWNIVGDGQVEPENEDPNAAGGAEGSVNPGRYTYIDETPMGVTTWQLGLNGNGAGHLGIAEDESEFSFEKWTDNGDGTITTSALDALPEHVPGWMNEDGSSTWKINADETCEPVEGGAAGGAQVNPGKYTYVEETPRATITWGVGVFGNGGGMIEITDGDAEPVRHDYESWTDNGDGTVTTGKWVEGTDGVDLPDWFESDGSCTWKLNADETCEPVNKK